MKILSLFSGIGAFEKALANMGVDYELVAYCEIDKYASKSYSAKGYAEANIGDGINLEHNSKTRHGRVGKKVAQMLTTSCNKAVVIKQEGLNE